MLYERRVEEGDDFMNLTTLRNDGWCETNVVNLMSLGDELVEIGTELGKPVALRNSTGLVQKLVPTVSDKAHPNSLSSQHALKSFPLHVDTAHWPTPCRYVVLGCLSEEESNRRTVLMDFLEMDISKLERDILFNAPFKITNGRNSFYGTVLSRQRNYVRYDPGCMTPATKYGHGVFDIFSEECTKSMLRHITWARGKIVIIDNWRMLHGRGEAIKEGSDRILYRVLVV